MPLTPSEVKSNQRRQADAELAARKANLKDPAAVAREDDCASSPGRQDSHSEVAGRQRAGHNRWPPTEIFQGRIRHAR